MPFKPLLGAPPTEKGTCCSGGHGLQWRREAQLPGSDRFVRGGLSRKGSGRGDPRGRHGTQGGVGVGLSRGDLGVATLKSGVL